MAIGLGRLGGAGAGLGLAGATSAHSGTSRTQQKKTLPSRTSAIGSKAYANSLAQAQANASSSSKGRSSRGSGSGGAVATGPALIPYREPSLNLPSLNLPSAPTYANQGLTRNAVAKRYNHLQVGGSPDLPPQINMDDYSWQEATISDLEKKYGFDYSRDYAARIAEAQAQAQRDAIQTSRERTQHELESAREDITHDFFQQYLQQQQDLTNSGLNAGIASDRNIRLDMSRQHAMADIYANAQLRNAELDRNLQTVEQQRIAQEEELFQTRLNQAFQQAMQLTGERRTSALAQLDRAIQLRQQEVEERWRAHEHNSMSVSEYEQFLERVRQQEMANALSRWDTQVGARTAQYNTQSQAAMQRYNAQMQAALRRAGY